MNQLPNDIEIDDNLVRYGFSTNGRSSGIGAKYDSWLDLLECIQSNYYYRGTIAVVHNKWVDIQAWGRWDYDRSGNHYPYMKLFRFVPQ